MTMGKDLRSYLAVAAALTAVAIVLAQLGYTTKQHAAGGVVAVVAPGLSAMVVWLMTKAAWSEEILTSLGRRFVSGFFLACFIIAGFAVKSLVLGL